MELTKKYKYLSVSHGLFASQLNYKRFENNTFKFSRCLF